MCVIIHKPKNVEISRDILHQCWVANPNGAGFMYSENGKLIVQKGLMKFKAFMNTYESVSPIDKDIIIHFRFATHGEISPEQTHPFIIQNRLGLVHNGIIKFEDDKAWFDKEEADYDADKLMDTIDEEDEIESSDTMLFCQDILEKLPIKFEDNEGIIALINEFLISNQSVIVFMDDNGKTMKLGNLFGQYEKHGCWFSNDCWDKVKWYGEGYGEETLKFDETKTMGERLHENSYGM